MGRYLRDYWYTGSLLALCLVFAGIMALRATGSDASPGESAAAPPSTATAPPTPSATDPVTLDFARALDLNAIRDALIAYEARNGAFPSTGGGLTTLCATKNDRGCDLREVNAGVPFSDGPAPYWYASDGRTYTLVARAALPQGDTSMCPDTLPPELSDTPIMCTSGKAD
jgi:hypothetical protein